MKRFVLTVSLILANLSLANTFSCQTPPDFKTGGLLVKLSLNGKITQNATNDYLLDYSFDLAIDCDEDGYCWTQDSIRIENMANNPNYRPVKYEGYLQFKKYITMNLGTYGHFSFIFPKYQHIPPRNFKAFMIMSAIDDHFGGTAVLNCQLTN